MPEPSYKRYVEKLFVATGNSISVDDFQKLWEGGSLFQNENIKLVMLLRSRGISFRKIGEIIGTSKSVPFQDEKRFFRLLIHRFSSRHPKKVHTLKELTVRTKNRLELLGIQNEDQLGKVSAAILKKCLGPKCFNEVASFWALTC